MLNRGEYSHTYEKDCLKDKKFIHLFRSTFISLSNFFVVFSGSPSHLLLDLFLSILYFYVTARVIVFYFTFQFLLLVHRNTIDFCMLILFAATLLTYLLILVAFL